MIHACNIIPSLLVKYYLNASYIIDTTCLLSLADHAFRMFTSSASSSSDSYLFAMQLSFKCNTAQAVNFSHVRFGESEDMLLLPTQMLGQGPFSYIMVIVHDLTVFCTPPGSWYTFFGAALHPALSQWINKSGRPSMMSLHCCRCSLVSARPAQTDRYPSMSSGSSVSSIAGGTLAGPWCWSGAENKSWWMKKAREWGSLEVYCQAHRIFALD